MRVRQAWQLIGRRFPVEREAILKCKGGALDWCCPIRQWRCEMVVERRGATSQGEKGVDIPPGSPFSNLYTIGVVGIWLVDFVLGPSS